MTKRKSWVGKYHQHKANAIARGHQYLLTYEEWLKIWTDSGHLGEWGLYNGMYVMARYGDKGHYQVGNVSIKLREENRAEQEFSEETCAKIGAAHVGNKYSLGRKASLEN